MANNKSSDKREIAKESIEKEDIDKNVNTTKPKKVKESTKKEEVTPVAPINNQSLKELADEEAEKEKIRKAETAKLVKVVLGDEEEENKKRKLFSKPKVASRDLRMEVLNAVRYNAAFNVGLSNEEVKSQEEKKLVNKSTSTNAKSIKTILFENIVTFFNILCILIAVALILVKSFGDLFFIVIMIANIVIGIIQEIKAKNTIDKLSLINAPTAIVVREKERINIPVDKVVLDDVVYLENGKQICADCVVIKGEIEVNESLLTGESVPILKKVGDTLYGGSFVSSGSCFARIDKIGSLNYVESLTSFAKKYKKAGSKLLGSMKLIIRVVGIIIIPLAGLLYYRNYSALKADENPAWLAESISRTAGAMIGMIPAGMFLLTSVTLAVSVVKLARKNILVQDLYCIEMLARVDVLCLDKTGTITDGTMRVNEVYEIENNTDRPLTDIVGSFLSATEDNNQTATALASHFGYSKALTPAIILPFSSQRKYSAVTFDKIGTYILGAPEYVCKKLTREQENLINDKAKEGFRVLALTFTNSELKIDKLPDDRIPVAIFILEDHIRNDAQETLGWFKENGVAIKVISGDNPLTVSEVARRVGVENAALYISLEGLSDPEVIEVANQYTVFGRVTPEQKRLLIRSMKAQGHTVAMTGDGVNDILALKEADCSVAMANGSEAARNVSHLLLLDSNFSHMPNVVHEGRRVVNNIQKTSALFLMKTLFSILLTLTMIIVGTAYPLKPRQLLLLEIFVIGIPSFFLAFQSNTSRIEGEFIINVIKKAFPSGLALVLSFLAIYIFKSQPNIIVSNTEFLTMSVFAITYVGWVSLVRYCQPIDSFRAVLCIITGLICLAALMFFPSFFELTKLSLVNMLFTIVVVESSYFLLAIISGAISKIKLNDFSGVGK